jgi:gliding motility-associated-like protein
VNDLSDSDSFFEDKPLQVAVPECAVEVFNAISPNGDGLNDTFNIQGIDCFSENSVSIYNRWGVLVYERGHYNNTTISFKGVSEGRATMNRGATLPVGTYYYTLKYIREGKVRGEKTGNLYLNLR